MQILQTAGDDFRRAGAAEIDKDDHRHALQLVAAAFGAQDGILRRVAALGGNHQLAARQEFLADVHRLVEQTAGIQAQIQNQRLHPLRLEPAERGFQFITGPVAKFRDADVADAVRAERKFLSAVDVLDHVHLDDGAGERELFLLAGRGPLDGHRHRRARFAAQAASRPPPSGILSTPLPSTFTMRSPVKMPARNPGESSIGATTVT